MTDAPAVKGAEIRELRRGLVSARDEQILRVVAMVDALPERGQADALIAPLRVRLAQLQARRPINFGRLLFMPLNPVIVPGPQWRRDSIAVPRTALPCMIDQVSRALPDLLASVSAQLAGGSASDRHLIARAGAGLWPAAAEVLAKAPMPADWSAMTGLSAPDHTVIRRAVVLVLDHAQAISKQIGANQTDAKAIAAMLQSGAAEGGDALGVLICVLLSWLPGAASQVLAATSAHSAPTGAPGRAASERAVEFVLDKIEADVSAISGGPVMLDQLRRTVALLDELTEQSRDKPGRTARITATRATVDAACRVRFEAALQTDMVASLELVADGEPEAVERLETAARELRRFEHVARRVNGSDHYDRLLRRTAGLLAPRGSDSADTRIDRLRLAEILLGPEQALAMLNAMAVPA